MNKILKAQVRIIAGVWRGRKIKFQPEFELRPTGDRIREMVFNWLAPYISGSNCLDLFAGSGALGFEALSRGAEHVTMVEKSRRVVSELKKNVEIFKTDQVTLICRECPGKRMKLNNAPFDIVFLDPPFGQGLIMPTLAWLIDNHIIHAGTLIYIEAESTFSSADIATHWEVIKAKNTKAVASFLCKTK